MHAPAFNSLSLDLKERLAAMLAKARRPSLARKSREAATMQALDAARYRYLPDGRLGKWDVQVLWRDGSLRVEGETTLPRACIPELDAETAVTTLRPEPARVTAPVLNLRREPRHAAELVSQAPLGTPLHVLKRPAGEWWLVQTPDGYVAWARSDNLAIGKEPDGTSLRTLPAVLAAPRIDTTGTLPLAAGSQLRLRERIPNGWLAETPAGIGVVIAENVAIVRPSPPSLCREQQPLGAVAVSIAHQWLGVPYLWGGKSGWGLDCSGLTQLVYEILGVSLPRDADQQAKVLPAVAHWDDLAAGDLLFYPGHVALWAGNGDVIHAASARGAVVREPVSETPWLRERCIGMGRPVHPL